MKSMYYHRFCIYIYIYIYICIIIYTPHGSLCSSSSPQIAKDVVLDYRPGRAIPHIRLTIRWEEGDIPVKLTGVASPQSFMLERPKNTLTRGKSSRYIIIHNYVEIIIHSSRCHTQEQPGEGQT